MQQYTIGRQIAVVARLWRGELDRRLQPCNLSQARFVLLTLLSEASGPLAQNDLAERAGIAGPTLVRQLDQLESTGLVERRDAPDDRRVKHVSITPEGKQAHKKADALAIGLRGEITAGLSHAEVNELHTTLVTLLQRLDHIRLSDSSK
jgi:MarR family transcriptional regulator, transcriptional regulator for hemolysin